MNIRLNTFALDDIAHPTITPSNVERLLDQGRLEVLMGNGNWWRLRRNGRLQTWKTRPDEFRLPVKYGLRGYGALDQHLITSGKVRVRPD